MGAPDPDDDAEDEDAPPAAAEAVTLVVDDVHIGSTASIEGN